MNRQKNNQYTTLRVLAGYDLAMDARNSLRYLSLVVIDIATFSELKGRSMYTKPDRGFPLTLIFSAVDSPKVH